MFGFSLAIGRIGAGPVTGVPDGLLRWTAWQSAGAMDFTVPVAAPTWAAPGGDGAPYSIMDFAVATT